MDKQRGIADGWLLLIALAVLGGGLWFAYNTVDQRGYQRGVLKTKAAVQVERDKAEAAARQKEAQDKAKKEKADAQTKRTLTKLRADNQRLRDERARTPYLPEGPGAASGTDRAIFDRAELERALQRLDEGVSELVGEGDEARVKLDEARKWAQP